MLNMKTLVIALGLALCAPAVAQGLVNGDFNAESGSWQDGEGPPGWTLSLDRDDQRGVVEDIDFAVSGERAFRFSALGRGFGDSRMDQCVILDQPFDALMLSVHVLADEPDPELALRLRVDFYADSVCDEDSANAGAERIGTDVGLSEERVAPGDWTRIESATRLASELGEDVRSARVSLRVRDRSDGGQPRDPARVVWLDDVSLEADVVFLPPPQRAALRDLYTATDGPNWRESLSWLEAEGSECSWHGVTCSPSGDTVVGLDLSGNGLIGVVPASITALTDLAPGEGLDLCWNDVLVEHEEQAFVNERHLGGDPGFCQGLELRPFTRDLTGNYYQPLGRDGEGFSLNMLSAGSALLYWASYDDTGAPLWLFGSGRADGRVLRIPDLYVTDLRSGEFGFERVGRASLVMAATEQEPDCGQAVLRFSAEGNSFAGTDGRELLTLDGLSACHVPEARDPLLGHLAGIWFDPALDGQGLTFTPHGADRLVLNWFGYDEAGEQVWRIAAGELDGPERVSFDPLLSVRGGSFSGAIDPDELAFEIGGSALLTRTENGWEFDRVEPDGQMTRLALQPLQAGPDLLASTGRRIDLEMADDDLTELYARGVFSNDRLPGQVRFDGSDEVQALTGLRFRGSSSRLLPKKAFNIRFESAQPLLYGSDRMNLNAMYTDPTMVREALSFELFRTLGQPASRTRHFDLWINGMYEGTHIHIQRVDETLLAQNGLNPDGTLVRDQLRDSEPDRPRSIFAFDLSAVPEHEREDFLAQHFDSRGDPDWSALLALIEWVQQTPPGAGFRDGFQERFEKHNFIDWLVLHWLIGDIDSFGDDYWLYLDHEAADARWMVIPWDKDLTFGSHFRDGFSTTNNFFAYEHPLGGGWDNELIAKFLATPELRAAAEERLVELMRDHFPPAWFAARIDQLIEGLEDSINIQPGPAAFALHEANHFSEPDLFHFQVEALNDFIALRYRFMGAQLDAAGGPIDRAEGTIPTMSTEAVSLVDGSGFTLAVFEPLTALVDPLDLELSVAENPDLVGINHEWILEVSGSEATPVNLSLFYRNEISSFWGRGNWWTRGEEAVGEQRRLVMRFGRDGDALETLLPTQVNPISNKATAQLELAPGRHVIQLVLLPTLSAPVANAVH